MCGIMRGVKWLPRMINWCQSSWHHMWHHAWRQVAPSVAMAMSVSLASHVTSCVLSGGALSIIMAMSVFLASRVASCVASSGALSCLGQVQSSLHQVWHHAWRQVGPSVDMAMSVFLASYVASSGALSCYGNDSLPCITCCVLDGVKWRPPMLNWCQSSWHHMWRHAWRQVAPSRSLPWKPWRGPSISRVRNCAVFCFQSIFLWDWDKDDAASLYSTSFFHALSVGLYTTVVFRRQHLCFIKSQN